VAERGKCVPIAVLAGHHSGEAVMNFFGYKIFG
jgi:hypothetical protein